MRDLHKVREEKSVVLSVSQIYVLLGLMSIVGCLIFVFGYYVGRHAPISGEQKSTALIPKDVERETVALLLAQSADEQAERVDQANPELKFHDVLAEGGGEPEEPTEVPTPKPTPKVEVAVVLTKGDQGGGATPVSEPGEQTPEIYRLSIGSTQPTPRSVEVGPEPTPSKPEPIPPRETEPTSPSPTPVSRAIEHHSDDSRVEPEQRSVTQSHPQQVEPDTTRRAETAQASPKPVRHGRWKARYTVQVSSFKDSSVAQRLVEQLQKKGFEAYSVSADVNGMTWYRVRVGFFEAKEAAQAESARLKQARPDLKPMITRE